jgi:Tol biopolymer transport system component
MLNVARLQAVWRPAPYLFVAALVLIVLALVAVLLGGTQRRVPAPFGPAANGSIVYDTKGTIEIVSNTGAATRTLIGSVPNAAAPVFSPDGQHIALWGDGSPDSLYVADSDGLNLRRVAENLWISTDKSPAWSPDSGRLVFSTETGPDKVDERLVVVDITTRQSVTIDGTTAGGARLHARLLLPTWSPDGTWIAFIALDGATGSLHLWAARPDGTGLREVPTTKLAATNVGVRWMPSGSRHVIAYTSEPASGSTSAMIFDLDTNTERPVSDVTSQPAFFPAWSPDGTRLAWLDGPNAGMLFLAPVDRAAEPTTLAGAGIGGPVAWSPDGTRLYGLTAAGTGLVIVTIDGSVAPIRLPHAASQGLPDWQRLAP